MRRNIPLDDIGIFVTGGTPSTKRKDFYKGTIPWITTVALNGGFVSGSDAVKCITNKAIENSATKLIPANSIMIGIRVGVGKIAINKTPICTNQDIVSIVDIDEHQWNKEYIAKYLQFRSGELLKLAKGATIVGITTKTLKQLLIPLVKRQDQDNAVEHLCVIERLIKTFGKQQMLYDQLVKSRFIEMFGDPVYNSKNLPTAVIDDIYEIIDGDRGKNYPKSKDFSNKGYCVFLDAGNVTEDGFDFTNTKYISKEQDLALRKGKLNRYDLVVTTRGTVGNIAYYADDIQFNNMRINSGMVILRPKQTINPYYFMEFFRNKSIYTLLISGSAQPQMPIRSMKSTKVLLPPIDLQIKFEKFVQKVNDIKRTINQAIEKLQLLYEKLAQEYFWVDE